MAASWAAALVGCRRPNCLMPIREVKWSRPRHKTAEWSHTKRHKPQTRRAARRNIAARRCVRRHRRALHRGRAGTVALCCGPSERAAQRGGAAAGKAAGKQHCGRRTGTGQAENPRCSSYLVLLSIQLLFCQYVNGRYSKANLLDCFRFLLKTKHTVCCISKVQTFILSISSRGGLGLNFR